VAAATTGVGALGVAAAAAGAGVLGTGAGIKTSEETHKSWKGNLPTTGAFCERVDVIWYKKKASCEANILMAKSDKRLGRVKLNHLQPYGAGGKALEGFERTDAQFYKEGCEIVKAEGREGSWEQFKSTFQDDECSSSVDKAIKTCSKHSKLCGPKGVKGFIPVNSADGCLKACNKWDTQVKCPEGQ